MIPFPYPEYHPIINAITEEIYQAYPELEEKYGEAGRRKCREDNQHHFHSLETAYQMKQEKIFVDYALWLNGILVKHGMDKQHLIDNFERIERLIKEKVDNQKEEAFKTYLQAAIQAVNGKSE
ncbi:hypothetical protein RYX45_07635 [Alkalihalophilus pseudofirmus]|uniref:Uncharacterized protein n=1 Tax=Alkalihalophilus pseudofirmus TaxID=79885 RepID=A0AAJ2NLV4_ALKPS|nr:hypothetical protein [Alkalihalophilus pseudofirmus]MDV2885048.1 hypothetical protein [Alkalihalophilus pseudofirmus]